MRKPPDATIPSYCARRQRTIAGAVPAEEEVNSDPARHAGIRQVFCLLTIAALHQGNYATIHNYLERELRYMDAGE
jgi:hypothetical protein